MALDFCFITVSSSPVLRVKCSQTGANAAHAVESKEVFMAKGIDNMGPTRVVVKSDNEPSMRAFAGCAKEATRHQTVSEESQECEPQSNGLAERCEQTVTRC